MEWPIGVFIPPHILRNRGGPLRKLAALLQLTGSGVARSVPQLSKTSKTSALLHLRDLLNRRGEVRCVYANLDVAQSAREDVGRGIAAMLSQIQQRSTLVPGGVPLEGNWSGMVKSFGADAALNEALTRWSLAESKPLVLLLDEYMDRCGAAAGRLVVFDRDPERSGKDRIFRREAATSAGAITIWGM